MRAVPQKRPSADQTYTIDSAIAAVRETAARVAQKKDIPRSIASKIADVIAEKLRWKYSRQQRKTSPFAVFSVDDIRSVALELVVGNPYTLATLLRYRCLNDLVYQLQFDRVLISPYFNYPEVIQRDLLIHMDQDIWTDLHYVQAIRNHLSSLETLYWQGGPEEDMVCSFVASAVLFGQVLFPGCDKALLSLRLGQLSIEPPVLLMPLIADDERSNAPFYRYFLPPPTSNYLLRYLLFMCGEDLARVRHMGRESHIFESYVSKPWKFPSLFKNWTGRIIEETGMPGCDGLTPSRFRAAALYQSAIETMTGAEGSVQSPPFLLSMHARVVQSSSFFCKYLPPDLNVNFPDPFLIEADRPIETQASLQQETSETLASFLRTTRSMLYELLAAKLSKRRVPKRSERQQTAADIKQALAACRADLSDAECENVSLLTKWYAMMLMHGKPDVKTINNYASDVKGLFDHIPWDCAIYALSKTQIDEAVTQALQNNSQAAIKGIRSFLIFTKSCHEDFELPFWRKWETASIEAGKPFISVEAVEEALSKCESFFVRRTVPYKDPEKRKVALAEAAYRSYIVSHMINMGFYAGLRASEFAHLLIENVIYDGGYTICVRMSKTKNGWRNIPLSLLAPPEYLGKFIAHYRERRRTAKSFEEPLFPRRDGTFWRSSYLSANVGKLFKSIGLSEMRFHYLRHSFANWFLLRWFAAFFPGHVRAESFTDLHIFNETSLNNIRLLVLGPQPKEGQECFSHVMAVLARLIGHGGPRTTMGDYIHVGDWLFYLLSKPLDMREIQMTSIQAQNFLQVSYPSLPDCFKGRGKKDVLLATLLDHQMQLWFSKYEQRAKNA